VSSFIRYDKVLRTFDSMLSEGVTNEMVKAGIDLQAHMSVSIINCQGSTLTVVNWTLASKIHALACKSSETQAILA